MLQQLVDEIRVLLPGLPLFLGPEHLSAEASPPRIVAVPTGATYEGPVGGGGKDGAGRVVRALWTRTENVDWYVWGRDYTEAEQASDELASALYAAARGSIDVVSGEWFHWQEAQWLHEGRVYVLRTRISRPVPRPERWGTLEQWAKECRLEVRP